MMVVTHEMGFAKKVAHRVIFMEARSSRTTARTISSRIRNRNARRTSSRRSCTERYRGAPSRARSTPTLPMKRLPSLNALQVFDIVARHGSFTRAAEYLCLTQGP